MFVAVLYVLIGLGVYITGPEEKGWEGAASLVVCLLIWPTLVTTLVIKVLESMLSK